MKILTTQHICSPLYHGILSPDEIPNTKRSMKVKVFLSFLGFWIPYTKNAAIMQENAKVMSILSSSIISTQSNTSDVFDAWSRPSLQSWRTIHGCTIHGCIAEGSYKHKFKHKFDTVQYTTQHRYIAKYRRSLSYAQWWQPAMNALYTVD